jgi:rhodanese-related sulfurtransferase
MIRNFGLAFAAVVTYISGTGLSRHPVRRPIVQALRHSLREERAIMDEGRFSISASDLYRRLGTAAAPLLIDVRRGPVFEADEWVIAGAVRRPPEEIERWGREIPPGSPVVVYCAHGHEVSQGAAAILREIGAAARYLEGGIAAWAEAKLPRRLKLAQSSASWVTRERPKIDRIACPWLIRRFIDPEASFLYVPTEQVFEVAKSSGAVAYDIPGAEPFSHDGELCSFDAFLKVYGITDAALDALAVIVRGADTARLELAPQAPGLLALSLGLSANFTDDHEMLEHGLTVYDAFYAWCRSCQDEKHNWNPAALKA